MIDDKFKDFADEISFSEVEHDLSYMFDEAARKAAGIE